ncbi:unnamed protein product [Durusdinium trenchii]|uniref:DRBM domain-containing protein n=1 Tax=Durusdinium trenchii TaxID=1381693 RepID=A0ABP0QPS8_9DINO
MVGEQTGGGHWRPRTRLLLLLWCDWIRIELRIFPLFLTALQELLQQKFQTPLNELLKYRACLENGGWIAQVTVSAEKDFTQTSHPCRTKREAEQEAAKLAYGHMRQYLE